MKLVAVAAAAAVLLPAYTDATVFYQAVAKTEVFTDDLVPALGSIFYPTLVSSFTTLLDGPVALEQNIEIAFGDYSGVGSISFGGLSAEIGSNFLALDVTGPEDKTLQFELTFQDIQLSIEVDVNIAFTTPLIDFTCPGYDFGAEIGSVGFTADVEVVDNGTVFTIKGVSAAANPLSLAISVVNNDPQAACDLVFPSVQEAVTSAGEAMQAQFADLLGPLVEEFVLSIETSIEYTTPLEIDFTETGSHTLTITPFLSRFEVDGDDFLIAGGADIAATLTEPSWRAGNSLTPAIEKSLPTISSEDETVNLKIGDSGLNSIIEAAWYLVWNSIDLSGLPLADLGLNLQARDESEISAPLCGYQATETDPCPYPPIKVGAGGLDGFLLWLIFLFDGIFIGGFTYHIVVEPPRVSNFWYFLTSCLSTKFVALSSRTHISCLVPSFQIRFTDENAVLNAQAQVSVVGNTLLRGEVPLLTIDSDFDAITTLPNYDGETGVLSDFKLEEVMIGALTFNFGWINGLAFWLAILSDTINSIVKDLIGGLVPEVNSAIAGILSSIPIKIPDLLIGDQTLSVSLVDTVIASTEEENDETGFLELGGIIEASVV